MTYSGTVDELKKLKMEWESSSIDMEIITPENFYHKAEK